MICEEKLLGERWLLRERTYRNTREILVLIQSKARVKAFPVRTVT